MNFWCFHPSVFKLANQLFVDFVLANGTNSKSEFFIPIIADSFIKNSGNSIKVIPTTAQWFGVTYKEDAAGVKQSIEALIHEKVYPPCLWK